MTEAEFVQQNVDEILKQNVEKAELKSVDEESFKNPHAQANKRLVDDAYHSILEWVLGKHIKWFWIELIVLCYITSSINWEKLGISNFEIMFFVDLSKSFLNLAFTVTMLLILFPASSKLRESAIKLFQKWVDKRT